MKFYVSLIKAFVLRRKISRNGNYWWVENFRGSWTLIKGGR